MPVRAVLIKKYENRRLYDSSNSRYVNVEEIAQMVREGADVQVVDAATGEDITRQVLAQIIMEDAKGPNSAFPLDVLKQMVIASGQAGKDGVLKYMRTVGDMYQNAYRAMNPPLNPFELFQRAPEAATPPAASSPTAEEYQRNLSELQKRIEQLERHLTRSGSTQKTTKKKAARRKKA